MNSEETTPEKENQINSENHSLNENHKRNLNSKIKDAAKFWTIASLFYLLKNNEEGTIRDFVYKISQRIKTHNIEAPFTITLTDGFLYRVVLPTFLDNNILIPLENNSRHSFRGRIGKKYRINLEKLDEFVVKNNISCKLLYMMRIKKGEIDLDII